MNLYNKFLEKFVLPIGDLVFNLRVMKELKAFRKFAKLSKYQLDVLQQERLNIILQHVSNNIPFYKNYFRGKQNDLLKLADFPIMTKKLLMENQDALNIGNKDKMYREVSSGSSGFRSEVFLGKRAQSKILAAQIFLWEMSGFQLGDKILQLGITPNRSVLKRIKDKLLRTNYHPAFNLDSAKILEYLEKYCNGKRQYFGGYASSLFLFAQVAKENKIEGIHFNGVISWGDKMFSHYRKMIENQFSTKVFDTYGSTEGLAISGECEKQNHHMLTPHIFLEILDENDKPVEFGEIGRVIVTRLDAFSMPLIRYDLGDLAIIENPEKYCECGRHFPMLKQIIGRNTDIVKTKTGKFMIVHFFTGIFEHISEIEQFQVVQNELGKMDIRYIPSENFDEEILRNIQKQVDDNLNEHFPIDFIEVEKISPSPSGKPQLIISDRQ